MNQKASTFVVPTRIIHGIGSVSTIPEHFTGLGANRALLVTDQGLTAAGVTEQVRKPLDESSCEVVIFDDVEEDPGTSTVHLGVQKFKEQECDLVIALGGGSPMCAGKGIALVAANGGTLTDYEGMFKAKMPPYPVIAVPTTAGSGTEVSKVTILTDEERNFKMSILDDRTFPPVAILDGQLTATLPQGAALVAGMDALAHALDAVWSVGATAFSDMLAFTSAAKIFDQLPSAALTGDLRAKQAMLEASSAANIATGTSLPGLAHVLSQPLGKYHISHGLGTGIMLPYTMEYNLPVASHKIAPIGRLLGDSGSDREVANRLLERLWDLMETTGFPTKLDPEKVPEEDLPLLVDQCTQVINYRINLRAAPPRDLEALYRKALS